ncbi:MAG: M23 family metallopeptidase [Deltaproteobacteria bacterium]|nr:M23 family metallopeptidase [Deltaproteobacteria bacterium]
MGPGFQDMLERILPPKAVSGRVFKPKVTTSDGIRQDFNAPRKGRENHGGVDINYHYESGTPLGQNGINKEHPDVGSPVSGKIILVDKERWGSIVIEDANGFKHEFRHLNEIKKNFDRGVRIEAGQIIGTMGGRGPGGPGEYPQHVHYSVTAPDGKTNINPEAYWNNTSGGKSSSSSFPWQRKTDFKPASVLDHATQRRLKGLSQGITIEAGETLRREGDRVWRIEPDGGTRGYFISP